MFLNEKRDAVMTVLKDIQEDATDDDQDDSDQGTTVLITVHVHISILV